MLPLASELGGCKLDDVQHVQREHQREGLRCRHQLAAFPVDVFFADQPLDGGGARRRCAEALGLHRRA